METTQKSRSRTRERMKGVKEKINRKIVKGKRNTHRRKIALKPGKQT